MKNRIAKLSLSVTLPALLYAAGAQAELMCTYTARISAQDKLNSQGEPLASSGISRASAAMIIRQDRANFYKFGIRDPEDQGDCAFHDAQNRDTLERMLAKGSASQQALRKIVLETPLISVDVYREHIDVSIIGSRVPSTIR